MIKYLDIEGDTKLSNLIKHSKIIYDKCWEFSGIVSNQRKMFINIKTPIEFKENLEDNLEKLERICFEIYEDDDEYAVVGVYIGTLAYNIRNVEIDEIENEIVQDSIYQNFIMEISSMDINQIEKKYLYEACECGVRNNRLAASAMLGCAAEYLLINLSNAYYKYLKNNGTSNEIENFQRKVINAKSADDRLDEFEKRVESNIRIFQEMGFENPKLNFNFLDIIRKVRNQFRHLTGLEISEGDLKMFFGNYQHFIKLAHKLIDMLPQHKVGK